MGRWKWQDRNTRENLLIEIEERRLFYVRLERFVNAVVKEVEHVPFMDDNNKKIDKSNNNKTANYQTNNNNNN